MTNTEMKNCNQCPNQCPADALRCGRGRAYFARLENGEEQENTQASHEEGRHGGKPGWHEEGKKWEDEGRGEGKRWEDGCHWEGRHGRKEERHGHGNENHHSREQHGSGKEDGEYGYGENAELYELMRMCGHYLYHSAGQRQRGGMEQKRVPKDELFSALDETEKESLKELLKKLTDSWKQD